MIHKDDSNEIYLDINSNHNYHVSLFFSVDKESKP